MSNLLIFDGDCLFCNRIALFLAKSDKQNRFKFTPHTSSISQKILKENHLEEVITQTVVVKIDRQFYFKSEAVYHFLKTAQLFPWLRFLIYLTPRVIANVIYDFIARRRKKIVKSCPTPDTYIREKFV